MDNLKPRLLVVCNQLARGGTEKQVITLLEGLGTSACERTLFLLFHSDFPTAGLERAGVCVDMPLRPSRWPVLALLQALFRYIRLQRRQPHDIVQFFLPASYILCGMASLLVGPRKRIMCRRSLNDYQKNHLSAALAERFLHGRMFALTGNSTAVCEQLREEVRQSSAPQVIHIANGTAVPVEHDREHIRREIRQEVRQELGLAQDALIIIITANLFAYKGHLDLLEALGGREGAVRARLPEGWALICIGRDAGTLAMAKEAAHRNGIAANVHWLGSMDEEAIARLNRAADLAVLPSHQEGLPNALLEAMAASLPVVATSVGGIPDIINSPATGTLVPPRDPASLGQAILELANDPEDRRSKGEAGRQRVKTHFSVDRMVDRYRDLYMAALKSRGGGGGGVMSLLWSNRWVKLTPSILVTLAAFAVVINLADPEEVWLRYSGYPVSGIFAVFAALFANVLVTGFRFHRLLQWLRPFTSWRVSVHTFIMGNLVGLVSLPLVGQIVGRHMSLAASEAHQGFHPPPPPRKLRLEASFMNAS